MYYLFAAPHVTIFSLSHNEMFEGGSVTCRGAPQVIISSLPLSHNEMFEGDIGNVTCPEGAYCLSGQCFCYGGRIGPNCDICKSKLHLVRFLHFTY